MTETFQAFNLMTSVQEGEKPYPAYGMFTCQ